MIAMHKTILFLGFLLTFPLFYFISVPVDAITIKLLSTEPKYMGLYESAEYFSEFSVLEMSSIYYILIMILVSIYSYSFLKEKKQIKMSISFLLLGLVMYLSESNMIGKYSQVFFAAVILSYIVFQLLVARQWVVILLLVLGYITISFGYMIDMIKGMMELEGASIYRTTIELLPDSESITAFYLNSEEYISEEVAESFGMLLVCLSSLLLFYEVIKRFANRNIAGLTALLTSLMIIAVGHSFLHYEYFNLNYTYMLFGKFKLIAYAISLIGFVLLILTNKYQLKKLNRQLTLINEDFFYYFMFLFLLLLPTVHGRINSVISVSLWLPFLFYFGVYLHYRHPALAKK